MLGGCISFAISAWILDDEDSVSQIKDIVCFLKVIYCFLCVLYMEIRTLTDQLLFYLGIVYQLKSIRWYNKYQNEDA